MKLQPVSTRMQVLPVWSINAAVVPRGKVRSPSSGKNGRLRLIMLAAAGALVIKRGVPLVIPNSKY